MGRRFGSAMLVAAGVVLGCALSTYTRIDAAPSQAEEAAADDGQDAIVDQLKQIKTQVKEINTLLRTGQAKVVVVINSEKQ